MRLRCLFIASIVGALVPLAFPSASFTRLGPSTYANAISADGNVVVGYDEGDRAFRWTLSGGIQNLGFLPGGNHARAYGVAADGSVVVGRCAIGTTYHGFRWTAGGGMQDLGSVPAAIYTSALATSANGNVAVGAYWIGAASLAFRWTAGGGVQDLGTPANKSSWASAVSSDGSVVVGGVTDNVLGSSTGYAFRWTAGGGQQQIVGMVEAVGLSADGSVVVGTNDAGIAARWTAAGGLQSLGVLPGAQSSNARSASPDGTVVVGQCGDRPFVWTMDSGMRDLRHALSQAGLAPQLEGWTLSAESVTVVNGEARIVGQAYSDSPSRVEAYVAVLPLPLSPSVATTRARVLWKDDEGRAMLLREGEAPASAPTLSTVFGPYPGWTPRLLSVGQNDRPRLLWEHTSGQISLWDMDSSGSRFESVSDFGPYPGWRVQDMEVGPDDRPRVLWRHTSGQISLWTMNAAGTQFETVRDYGPYNGWAAHAIAVGPDGLTRVLWRHTSGQLSMWRMAADGSFRYLDYGPYPGWLPEDLKVSSSNEERVAWRHSSGQLSLWTVGLNGAFYNVWDYGPYSGWNLLGIAEGAERRSRVLWGNAATGTASLWGLLGHDGLFSWRDYGAPTGLNWRPTVLASPAP